MTKNTTKRALSVSILSLLLCVSMLVGTTFAWFTDTATTGVNTIVSGNLDIVLEYWDGDSWEDAEKTELNFIAKDGNKNILWEPGCTYELPKIRVRNVGNLNARVILKINGIRGDEKLFEALEFKNAVANTPASILNGSQAATYNRFEGKTIDILWDTPDGDVIFDWPLAAAGQVTPNSGHTDTSAEFTISAHMKETAGNEYQNLSMEGISIMVLATQGSYEYDSFDRDYDLDAPYPAAVIDGVSYSDMQEALAIAMETGAPLTLTQDLTLVNSRISVKDGNTLSIDLNGYAISGNDANGRTVGVTGEGTKLVLSGDGTVTNDKNATGAWPALILANNSAAIEINGGTYAAVEVAKSPDYTSLLQNAAHVVINGGVFTNNFNASLFNVIYSSTLEINGGYFESVGVENPDLLDVEDHATRISTIIIRGGTFVNYDPRTDADDWDMTDGYSRQNIQIPEGYTVVSQQQANGDVWYTVVAE